MGLSLNALELGKIILNVLPEIEKEGFDVGEENTKYFSFFYEQLRKLYKRRIVDMGFIDDLCEKVNDFLTDNDLNKAKMIKYYK